MPYFDADAVVAKRRAALAKEVGYKAPMKSVFHLDDSCHFVCKSENRFLALTYINALGAASSVDIGENTGINKSYVTTVLKDLVSEGLIEEVKSNKIYKKTYRLTNEGKLVIKKIMTNSKY